MFRIFLGAPTASELHEDAHSYQWQTISPHSHPILPPATVDAVSRRISRIYQNIIFDESALETEGFSEDMTDGDQTNTIITWPPTVSRVDQSGQNMTFLDTSKSRTHTQYETQEDTQSYNYSDASSIARFPTFHFNLHSLTSLAALASAGPTGSRKLNVLLAVLEVEGPDTIQIKRGVDAGKEVSVLKLILGDDGNVCRLTAWREVAEAWGGISGAVGVKRGDVVLIENVTASCDPKTSPSLTASPYMKSKLEICYRTMAYTREDIRLRPDLRLGESDASVRRVATIARWFEAMAGLSN
ncbi:hypothetical protein BD779DRAFT_1431369 [Infundibulicybe gibba]|nr:hypothetical protein BD779DRAFT_1431369 [Infundibulicybe gibba]